MKKSNIKKGIITLVVIASAAGLSATALAASNNTGNNGMFGLFRERPQQNLTEAQITEMKTKHEAVKAALEASDYNAWVTAVKAVNENSPELKNVTSNNFSDYVAKYKDRVAKMTEQKVKQDAVKTAIENSDYNAWVTAEKAVNENSPLLKKITSDNFSRYVEANKLRIQSDNIMKELGLNNGEPGGFGPGGPGGHGGMRGNMMGGTLDNNQDQK